MSLVTILIKEVTDRLLRENFKNISQFIENESVLKSRFKHLTVTFSRNETRAIAHGLNATPKDLIQTRKIGTGSITYNYVNFNRETIEVTTTGTSASDPMEVRLLVGSYD